MSSSPDLSWRARLALAVALVITAASLPRLAAVRQLAGGTAVPLAAGVCAVVALVAARLPLGFSWGPAGSHRAAPEVARGFAVGAACAAALIWQGNDVLLARLWRDDRAASLALLAGVAAWGAAVAATRQRALWRWYGVATAAALLPAVLLIAVLRPVVPSSGFAAAFVFFLVADTTVAFVTEELAFRRALVGPPDSAGLGALALMAVVFGLWHAVQPGYGGAPLGTLLGTALGGFVAGCVYVLSGSLTAAALYHGLHNAPLKALGGAPIATGRAGLASGLAFASTAALAIALGWLVWRRGGRESAGLS
jgi:membrane protease YdiL (CAAX protease family)